MVRFSLSHRCLVLAAALFELLAVAAAEPPPDTSEPKSATTAPADEFAGAVPPKKSPKPTVARPNLASRARGIAPKSLN